MPNPAASSDHDPDQTYPLVGETVGMWRLAEGIGRGGMGEVYAAEYDFAHLFSIHAPKGGEAVWREIAPLPRSRQAQLAGEILGLSLPADQRFAIKICNARSNTAGYRRFLQEAQVAQRLSDHPYIITVHWINGADDQNEAKRRPVIDHGRHRDLAYMVMDLERCSFDRGRLSLGEAVHIVRCIATALDHAHAQGVIHRDLKPENILGTIDHPYLTDFGIAKEVDSGEGLTRTGQIIGTLDYMSPEQATDAKNVDHRSDIYSLGVVLYEFATQGKLPYAHKQDRESCLTAIRSEHVQPTWPREHVPGFPVALERVILKAMAFRREQRYQSMGDFVADLDRFTRGEPISWYGRIPLPVMVRAQMRFHPKVVMGSLSSAAVLLLVLGIIFIPRWIDSTRRTYEKDLARLDPQVAAVRDGRRTQLDRENSKRLADLATALGQGSDYADLRERLTEVQQNLLRFRQLNAVFVPDARLGETVNGDAAIEELAIATGVGAPQAWHAERGGLLVTELQQMTLKPYGTGTLFAHLVILVPATYSGYLMATQEVDDRQHLLAFSVAPGAPGSDGQPQVEVTLGYREDEKPAIPLRRERLPAGRLNLALELTATGVRSWIGGVVANHPQHGLREGAPAMVGLTLPKDATVERIRIAPRSAR